MGVSRCVFYRVVVQWMVGGQGEGGNARWNFNDVGYGRWKLGRGGDEKWLFSEGKTGGGGVEEARQLHDFGGERHREECLYGI
jgi:hypothetical protein